MRGIKEVLRLKWSHNLCDRPQSLPGRLQDTLYPCPQALRRLRGGQGGRALPQVSSRLCPHRPARHRRLGVRIQSLRPLIPFSFHSHIPFPSMILPQSSRASSPSQIIRPQVFSLRACERIP